MNDIDYNDGSQSVRGPRVRGPAEARAARGGGGGDLDGAEEPLPASVKGADFKTLQDMIARGIQDAEVGARGLEADITLTNDVADLQRHREALRRRREEEAQAKQRDKEAAREKRRREDEARRRRLEEELEREEQQERQAKDAMAAKEAECRREFKAAMRIQANVRGRRSRAGKHTAPLAKRAELHVEPLVSRGSEALFNGARRACLPACLPA